MVFWGSESDVYFQKRCRLNFFSPIWSHVNEKNGKQSKIQNFEKQQQNKMVWRYGG